MGLLPSTQDTVGAQGMHLFLEMSPHGMCGFHEVVVWDFGEEEMVDHMPIGDVVAQQVNGPSVCAIYSLKSYAQDNESQRSSAFGEFTCEDIGPCAVIIHNSVLSMVLQVCHCR